MEVGFLPRLRVCVLKSASRAAAPQPARRRPPRTTQLCSSGDCHNYLWLTFLRHCPQTARTQAPHSPPDTRCPPCPPPAGRTQGGRCSVRGSLEGERLSQVKFLLVGGRTQAPSSGLGSAAWCCCPCHPPMGHPGVPSAPAPACSVLVQLPQQSWGHPQSAGCTESKPGNCSPDIHLL